VGVKYHLHGITYGEACSSLQLIGDDEKEATGPGNDGAFHRESIETALNTMTVASRPQPGGGESPASGGVERHLDRSLLVPLKQNSGKPFGFHWVPR
jgi:hypothetical protein